MRQTSVPSRITSRPGHLICPVCGSGKLGFGDSLPLASCDPCGCAFDDVVRQDACADSYPSRRPRQTRMRMRLRRDATPARWHVPLPRLPNGGGAYRV